MKFILSSFWSNNNQYLFDGKHSYGEIDFQTNSIESVNFQQQKDCFVSCFECLIFGSINSEVHMKPFALRSAKITWLTF